MLRPSLSFLFDHPNNVLWGLLLNPSLYISLDSLVTSFLLGPNILKHPQPTFLPQCENSTVSSFLLCSLYLQKLYNHCNSFLSFLVSISSLDFVFQFRWPSRNLQYSHMMKLQSTAVIMVWSHSLGTLLDILATGYSLRLK
jgi:hypothetical protein